MNGKQFRAINDILECSSFERDDIFEDKDLVDIKDEEFQRLRRNYLEAKNLLCDYLGYEEASTYGK